MEIKLPPAIKQNQNLANLVSFLIISAMMASVGLTVAQLLTWLPIAFGVSDSTLQWGFLPILMLVIALEAIFSRPIAAGFEGRERILYHLAEWITITVMVKFIFYLFYGWERLLQDLPLWQKDFLLNFFTPEFFGALFLCAFVWWFSRTSANEIEQLNVDPDDLYWDLGKLQNNRISTRSEFVSRVLWTGVLLVIIGSFVRLGIMRAGQDASLMMPVANIMAYFFLALVLLSQTQFSLLRGRWFWHQTQVSTGLVRNWIRVSLILFAILAIISFILPTSYSIGFLETLNIILVTILNAGFLFIQILLLPVVWLLNLAGCTRQTQSEQPQADPPLLTPPVLPQPGTSLPWLEFLQSLLFWIIFLGVVVYALVLFVRQNPALFTVLGRLKIISWLKPVWQWLDNVLHFTGKKVSSSIRSLIQRLSPKKTPPFSSNKRSWINFRQLNPREQVIFYYLRLLDRSRDHGLARRVHQTPSEYASELKMNLPEVEEDIQGMTNSFLEARYSQHLISPENSNLVQRLWRNISRSLSKK